MGGKVVKQDHFFFENNLGIFLMFFPLTKLNRMDKTKKVLKSQEVVILVDK